jgi:transposase-like protein
MNCSKCHSEHIIKYGIAHKLQRYLCHDCHTTFTLGSLVKVYDSEFINQVMEEYCHQRRKAREVLEEFKISSRTLIKRKKQHQKKCNKCKNQIS